MWGGCDPPHRSLCSSQTQGAHVRCEEAHWKAQEGNLSSVFIQEEGWMFPDLWNRSAWNEKPRFYLITMNNKGLLCAWERKIFVTLIIGVLHQKPKPRFDGSIIAVLFGECRVPVLADFLMQLGSKNSLTTHCGSGAYGEWDKIHVCSGACLSVSLLVVVPINLHLWSVDPCHFDFLPLSHSALCGKGVPVHIPKSRVPLFVPSYQSSYVLSLIIVVTTPVSRAEEL